MHVSAQRSTAMERATLRLTRGVSKHAVWLLCNGCGSSLITIGASASSDWQILAPRMAGHAMSIGFIDGVLYACSGSGARVTVNGRPLPETLEKISAPGVLAFGTAELMLTSEATTAVVQSGLERERVTWPDTPAWDPPARRASSGFEASSERAWRRSQMDAPSVLGREAEPQSQVGSLQHIAFATLVAASYFAWLYLLDHL